ncbi:hypothetical protein [Halomonas sp. 25-S5]|nr:hypothetical protein [Halomonas sp. 25-S5]
MNASLGGLLALGSGYLLLLFLAALAVERHWIPSKRSTNPTCCGLS